MALLSALVHVIAEVEAIEKAQVAWVARHLREAGLLSQAGRGRGAAHMQLNDAVNLLIAVNTTSSVKEVVPIVEAFRNMGCPDRMFPNASDLDANDPIDAALLNLETAGDLITNILRCYVGSPLSEPLLDDRPGALQVRLRFVRPRYKFIAEMEFEAENIESLPKLYSMVEFSCSDASQRMGDRREETMITGRTLAAVGRLLSN